MPVSKIPSGKSRKKKKSTAKRTRRNLHGQEIGVDERGDYFVRFGTGGRQ